MTTGAGVPPGEQPPVEPELAKQHTADGALQFAAYFIKALSWSIATTDSYLITELSAPDCQACNRFVRSLAALRSKGEVRGGRLDIETISVTSGRYTATADRAIEFRLKETGASVVGSASTSPPATKEYLSIVFVSWRVDRWQVVEQGAP